MSDNSLSASSSPSMDQQPKSPPQFSKNTSDSSNDRNTSIDNAVSNTLPPENGSATSSTPATHASHPDAVDLEPRSTSINNSIDSVVGSPQKEQDGSQNAYISYLITTKSNNPTFQAPCFQVRRRYTDFSFLYNSLYSDYPAVAVPPLADKSRFNFITGDRFGPEFTSKRATSLNRFLDRISQHPILRKSPVYLNFLETSDWNSFKKSLLNRHQQAFLDSEVLHSNSDSSTNTDEGDKHNDDLLQVKERIGKLEDNLQQVEKSFTKVLRRQQDLSSDLEDFSQQLIKLAGLEHSLSDEILSFANGTHTLSQEVNILRERADRDYVVSLKDMQNYVLALKSLLKLREQKQNDLVTLVESLNKTVHEKDNVVAGRSNFLRNKIEDVRGVDHETSRKERLYKLESKIEGLRQEVDNAKKNTKTFQEISFTEADIFENIKQAELKKTLTSLTDSHINFYQRVITQWEALL